MGYYNNMNLQMEEKIKAGMAIDLSECERVGRRYIVPDHLYVDGMDYCDTKAGWIWSLGRRKSDGVILASLSPDLYDNQEFECIWLR